VIEAIRAEDAEDAEDAAEADVAMDEPGEPIPWEQVWRESRDGHADWLRLAGIQDSGAEGPPGTCRSPG
jgi:hypothetical protein